MPYLPSRKAFLSSTIIFTTLIAILCSSKYSSWHTSEFICENHQYTTEIISTDPLLIYINNFISSTEADALVAIGEPSLAPSLMSRSSSLSASTDRTSHSAPLPPSSPPVSCILSRARSFLGPSLLRNTEDFGTPQLVHYTPGQKFDLQYDWYPSPQPLPSNQRLRFNRIASFFVYLDQPLKSLNMSAGGETWFPDIEVNGEGEGKWRMYEEEGTAFRPVKGNAVFWVNLYGNGTGDRRMRHAGLPLMEGVKTAMNIWPRRVYG